MKKLILGLFSLILMVSSINAQGDPKKDLKQASRALGSYNLDPSANEAKLFEAIDKIQNAVSDSEIAAKPKVWITKGQIFNAVAAKETNAKYIEANYEIKYPQAALEASDAFMKVFNVSDKKGDYKEAVAGLTLTEGHLTNFAYTALRDKDYEAAFENFAKGTEVSKVIIENEGTSRLSDDANLEDHRYYSGICAYYLGRKDDALKIFEELHGAGDANPTVYEMMYNIYSDTDKEKAHAFLMDGREKYPDDQGLLYAEINYSLKEGKLDELIDKLKVAAAKDTSNVSIFTTLASVYDQLHTREKKEGNVDKSQEYFDHSYNWYVKSLEIDSANFMATYSLGTLFYNKGAGLVVDLNAVADDLTPAGTKKYNEIKADMDKQFESALPYFLKAEELNSDDFNTILALKEIYARANNFEKSNEYKAKLEAMSKSDEE
jgi:tetratricopeptide (TPR) repeat protein